MSVLPNANTFPMFWLYWVNGIGEQNKRKVLTLKAEISKRKTVFHFL